MGFGKDGKGAIIIENRSQALSTLATAAVIFIGTKLPIAEDFRMLKAQIFAGIEGLAAGEGNGLLIGLAHGDLTVGEIKDSLDMEGPSDRGDLIKQEQALRPIFLLGALEKDTNDTQGHFRSLWGSEYGIVAKPRWTFQTTDSWNWFIYNEGGAVLTTGSTVRINTKCFGVWLD